ncbi:MAG: DUF4870 domain-containing protein [Actinomycetia bacterium]|nr:DUF4870 domain-containing protein [Actinomycetes bacterium]
MDPKLAALLAYLFGWVGGLIFYIIESKNKYIRFHALQSILFNVSVSIAFILLGVVFGILGAIPGIGVVFALLGGLIYFGLAIGSLVVWIILMVKAYQGEKWLLPVIGDIAEQNS